MARINWNNVVNVIKNEILPFFESEGVKPTLRTIFYALVSKNIIPNTRSSYNRLSRVLVKARQKGIFEWDFLEDKTRYVIRNFSDYTKDEEDLKYCKEACESKLEKLDIMQLINSEFNYLKVSSNIGYWANQRTIVEVWIEKDALAKTIDNWIHDLHVNIRVNRGYSSWTFIYENVKELSRILEGHEKVVVLYCGDLDPSGVDIQRFLKEALEYFGMTGKVELRRVAVTPEQVVKYGLPPRPEDAETLKKLERDPRSKSYKHEYIVELDALVAYVPEEFRKILRETIEKYHDKEIYQKAKEKAKEISEKSEKIVEEYKKKALEKILNQVRELLDKMDKDTENK